MAGHSAKLNINTAVRQLRELSWSADEGDLLGSEEELTATLGVSRPTVRQVARLLESEGLLRVKRGVGGGYFAARPSVDVIEASVSAYLQMIEADGAEVSDVASALWTLIVRKAAALPRVEAQALAERMRHNIAGVGDGAGFAEILRAEESNRGEIFNVINAPYIELILQINTSFASQHFPQDPMAMDDTPEHAAFVKAWRRVTLLEIECIGSGDLELAEQVARHYRRLFQQRLWLTRGH